MKKCYVLLSFLALFLAGNVFAGNLEKAWKAFAENDLETAEDYFKDAANEPDSRADAYIGLTILKIITEEGLKEFEYFTKAVEYSPNKSALTFALYPSLHFTGNTFDINKDRMKFLEELVEDENYHGTMKASLYRIIADQLYIEEDFKDSEEAYENVGSVKTWSSVGTFENISGSGYNKHYPPIDQPKRSKDFSNKNNAPVNWEEVKYSDAGVWIDFAKRYNYSNSIVYAQTFCKSPDEREVILNVGTSGTVKVWLNDFLVYENSEERNNGMDTYSVKTQLSRGYNRILVQVGESDIISNLNFNFRITDDKYMPMKDLSYEPFFKPYQKATNLKAEFLPLFSETYYEEQVEKKPDYLLNYILLAETYMKNDKLFEAREVLDDALKIAPKCSYIRWQLAQIHSGNDNETDLNIILEKLKEDDPDNPLSIILFLDEALNAEDYVEAREYVEDIENFYGKNSTYYEYLISIILKEEEQGELIETIEEAYEKYPYDYTFVEYAYLVEDKINKNTNAAIRILKKYLKKRYTYSALIDYVGLLFKNNQATYGIAQLENRLKYNPSATGSYAQIADIYYQMGDYRNALYYYEEALKRAPYIGAYHAGLGKCYKELDEKDNAIEAFENCLLYYPYSYDERRELRELKDEKPVFDYFDEPDYYKIAEETDISQEDFPEDNSVLILDETQKVVYKSGADEEMRYMMVKVLNPSGIDSWKDYYIPSSYYSNVILEKAEVIKKNGSKVKAEQGGRHLVFTSLEVGDVILIVYKKQNYSAGRLAKHFWDKFYLTSSLPAHNIAYKLLVEDGIEFQHKTMNTDVKEVVETKGNFKLYSWTKEKAESLKDESYKPNTVDIAEILHFSTINDWDFIAKWYYDLSESKIDADYVVKKKLQELFPDGWEGMSEMEKAKLLYNYIAKDVRYSSVSFLQSSYIPKKASKTILTRIGDCKDVSTLFVTLAREVGLEAHIVLVNTRDNGKYDLVLPNPGFNHAIAAVMIDGEKYYVDLTSDLLPFSTFTQSLKNSFAIDIIGDESVNVDTKYLDPDTRVNNNIIRKTAVSFDGNQMKVNVNTNKIGTYAAYTRSTYRDIGNDMRRKEMTEALSSDVNNVTLNELKFDETLDNLSDTVNYEYTYTVQNALTNVGSMTLMKIPFADEEEPRPFTAVEDRELPLEIWRFTSRDKYFERLEIELPEGKRLVERSKDKHYECEFASYDLTFELDGRTLIIERTFILKDTYVPAEKYNEFKEFFNNVVAADETQIGLK